MQDIRAGSLADIVATEPAPVNDVNVFVVMKRTAKKYKLKTVSDLQLKGAARKLTFGGPPECESRALCLGTKSHDVYGLQFKQVKKLDAGGPITTDALRHDDVQVAVLFSASSVIPENAVILRDDKGLQGADNPFVLIRKDKATPKVLKTINRVSEEAHDEGVQRDGDRDDRRPGRTVGRRPAVPRGQPPPQLGAQMWWVVRGATSHGRPTRRGGVARCRWSCRGRGPGAPTSSAGRVKRRRSIEVDDLLEARRLR